MFKVYQNCTTNMWVVIKIQILSACFAIIKLFLLNIFLLISLITVNIKHFIHEM